MSFIFFRSLWVATLIFSLVFSIANYFGSQGYFAIDHAVVIEVLFNAFFFSLVMQSLTVSLLYFFGGKNNGIK